MGVVERGAGRNTGAAVVVIVLVIVAGAFAIGRSSGSDAASSPPTTATPATTGDPGTPSASSTSSTTSTTAWRAPTSTTLLTDPPAGAPCVPLPAPDVVACLQNQRDDLGAALDDAWAGASTRFAAVGAPVADVGGAVLDQATTAQQAFLAYRQRACSWAAERGDRTEPLLGSQEAVELACSNALTNDRVLDLRRVADAQPLVEAIGWQHPLPSGRVCDDEATFSENDSCGSPDLRDAEARLESILRYLLFHGDPGAFEATGAWLAFGEADCSSRLALFSEQSAVDRVACTYESFARHLMLVEDTYGQIVSFD